MCQGEKEFVGCLLSNSSSVNTFMLFFSIIILKTVVVCAVIELPHVSQLVKQKNAESL